jgi:flagellar biosynthesis/type III secretory pathway protein FliH
LEAINMVLTEWIWENARAVWLEESWKEAWEKGWEEGWKEGLEEGREERDAELLEMIDSGRGIKEIRKRLVEGSSESLRP